jgi:hypothetical protein
MPQGQDPSDVPVEEPTTGESAPAPEPAEESAPMVCATCGAVPADEALALLTWARGVENRRDVWTCETCSRRHLRSIEGKLDSSWW